MRLLITGGLGYVGSHLAVLALNTGVQVFLAGRQAPQEHHQKPRTTSKTYAWQQADGVRALTGLWPHCLPVDVNDYDSVFAAIQQADPDVVVHAAAMKGPANTAPQVQDYYRTNVLGITHVLQALQSLGGRPRKLINLSSAAVYGAESGPYEENLRSAAPQSISGFSQAFAEQVLADAVPATANQAPDRTSSPQISAVSLRIFNVYGAHPSGLIGENLHGAVNMLTHATQAAWKYAQNPYDQAAFSVFADIDGQQVQRDYVHVLDVASGVLAAAYTPISGVANLSSGKAVSAPELLAALETATGVHLPVRTIPVPEGVPIRSVSPPERLTTECGWQPRFSLPAAAQHAWQRQQHWATSHLLG